MGIRKGDWKLLRMSDNAFREEPYVITDLSAMELYNLKEDMGETKNLASANPEKAISKDTSWQRCLSR